MKLEEIERTELETVKDSVKTKAEESVYNALSEFKDNKAVDSTSDHNILLNKAEWIGRAVKFARAPPCAHSLHGHMLRLATKQVPAACWSTKLFLGSDLVEALRQLSAGRLCFRV